MVAKFIQPLWRALPAPIRTGFWGWFHQASLARPPVSPSGIGPGDRVVIAGMFRSASGLGAWARSNYRILKQAGFDVVAVDVSEYLSVADLECDIPFSPFPADPTGTLILHVNGPETQYCLRMLGLRRGRRWRVIGAWAWELEIFPAGWEEAFPFLSEIWALSDFAAAAFRRHEAAPPVRVLPIAVAPDGAVRPQDRPSERPYTVLVMADALSTLERKNPVGAIRAFRLAFADRTDCRLILKVRNLDTAPEARASLLAEIGDAANIDLVQGSLSEAEQMSLISGADILMSLHRAEGFGLGPAEAMTLGVPVIATNWSGNLLFMDTNSAALVPYERVPVPEGCAHYDLVGAEWAEPDVEVAADWLRQLEAEPDLARSLAERAAQHINAICGIAAVQAGALRFLEHPGRADVQETS